MESIERVNLMTDRTKAKDRINRINQVEAPIRWESLPGSNHGLEEIIDRIEANQIAIRNKSSIGIILNQPDLMESIRLDELIGLDEIDWMRLIEWHCSC